MAMNFYEKFRKYTPSDAERIILDRITDFTAQADVDRRMIQVNADFDTYVSFDQLSEIEVNIKKAYDLNYMAIHPHYTGIDFSIEYMGHVFYELSRNTAQGNGFFEGAETKLEGAEITTHENVLSISLKNGGKKLLVSGGCDKTISDVIYKMFGTQMTVDFCGVTSIEFDEINTVPLPKIRMPKTAEEKAAKENLAAAVSNAVSDNESFAEVDSENAVIKSGGMMFDISEIQDVYNRIKSISVIPLRNATLDSEAFTVCGEVFSYQKKLTKNGDKYIVSFYLTDNDASAVVKMIYSADRDEEYSKIKDGAAIILRGTMQIDKFDGAPAIKPTAIGLVKRIRRTDNAEKKRVELHLHTTLSTMD